MVLDYCFKSFQEIFKPKQKLLPANDDVKAASISNHYQFTR
jgi:hypothetical protein